MALLQFHDRADAKAQLVVMGGDGFISNRKEWLAARRRGQRSLSRPPEGKKAGRRGGPIGEDERCGRLVRVP
jgi:hypothetical protein